MTVIQRLELLAEDVEKLQGEGGGGDLSAYLTKDEASSTYETQSSATASLALKADKATTYTKTEVDEAIASAAGGDVIVDGDNVKTKNAGLGKGILIGNQAGFNSAATDNPQIAIGVRARTISPASGIYPIAIGYQAIGHADDIVIGSSSSSGNNGKNVIIGQYADSRGNQGVGIGDHVKTYTNTVSIGVSSGGFNAMNGVYVGSNCMPKNLTASSYGQISIGATNITDGQYSMCLGHQLKVNTKQVVLGRYNVESDDQDCFIVANGTDNSNRSNLVEITTPFTVSTDGIEVNGVPFAPSVSDSSYASTTAIPTDATNVACDVPYSHIVKHNDFTLLKSVNSYTYAVRFQYSQSTTSNTCFYKGSFVNPSSNTLETYVVEIGPDSDLENTLVCLIGKYEVNRTT